MPRVKIDLPEHFTFHCEIPIRITDINYGGHVGNDTILTIIHEARMKYLGSLGYSEMNFEGSGMIMSDVSIQFKSELFYGDTVSVFVACTSINKIGFELAYKLQKTSEGKTQVVANATTNMICYNYAQKKIVPVPVLAAGKLSQP